MWRGFRRFGDEVVSPLAGSIDRTGVFPADLMRDLGRQGLLGVMVPADRGGRGLTAGAYGLLSEELGRVCSNTRNFVAVQDMVVHALWRWGTAEQRETWLKPLIEGERTAAFALTEPTAGSDAQHIVAEARDVGSQISLTGTKRWISFGQVADVLLVFAQYGGRHTAFLVPSDTPGVRIEPIDGMLGLSGSMLAEITFDECRLPVDCLVGKPGAGLVFVASSSLDIGRLSTAGGCVGLLQACLDETTAYAAARSQFGKALAEHQLIQQMIADMITESRAARLLYLQAGAAAERADSDALYLTLVAKYFASTAAARAAANAVQVQGARGMSRDSVVGRFFRDAKALEVIEGTTQIVQQLLGQWGGGARHPILDASGGSHV